MFSCVNMIYYEFWGLKHETVQLVQCIAFVRYYDALLSQFIHQMTPLSRKQEYYIGQKTKEMIYIVI